MIYIRPQYRQQFEKERSVDDFFAIEGEISKQLHNRKTLKFERGGKGFFIKCHAGIGWLEIIKNLTNLRLPVLGARTEWLAIQRVAELGVSTLTAVGYGVEGIDPARQRSFLITEDLGPNISLEKLTKDWRSRPPDVQLKRTLIRKLADMARRLHENGVNHRDFYICHFLLRLPDGVEALNPENLQVYLIDLHRVQRRSVTPQRWIVKDIGGLFFSSMDIGLTNRDLLRFMKAYRGKPLRTTLERDRRFWRKVQNRALKLYRSHWNKEPGRQTTY